MPDNRLLLEIKDLSVKFPVPGGEICAVNRIDLAIPRGKTIGIVGESGCGKSVFASSILKLNPKSAKLNGQILLHREKENEKEESETIDILHLKERSRTLQQIRGGDISMIFQEPMRALFPLRTVEQQLSEAICLHSPLGKKEVERRCVELLKSVGIRDCEKRLKEYPHQFSGGMAQRVMIAIALASSPSLLIADEPTTSLDVTIQAQVLALIQRKQREMGMSILFISHDMAVVMEMADEIAVMYLGRIVEKASAVELFEHPMHPYTQLLLKAIPSENTDRHTRLAAIEGSVPIPLNLPKQCGFCERCPLRYGEECSSKVPSMKEVRPGHFVACLQYEEE